MNNNVPKPEDFFKQKIIDGKRYGLTELSGWAALKGFTVLSKTAAPVMGEILDSRNVDESMMFDKQNTFREVLTLISHNLDKPEVNDLIAQMLNGATCEGQVIDVDSHFKGSVHHMLELIIFAMELNFKKLFMESGMLQSMMGTMQEMMVGIPQE